MKAPDEYTIEFAVKAATEAFRAGRRDSWPGAEDISGLQDELEAQPDEGDRRVFIAAWHVHTLSLVEADARVELNAVPPVDRCIKI